MPEGENKEAMKAVRDAMVAAIKPFEPSAERFYNSGALLRSNVGCPPQDPHTDYCREDLVGMQVSS
jgi:hypothetical protein